jgi:hypothetical protein
MIAISVLQPWAALIATGKKKFETRSWKPAQKFIGEDIIIHAGKSPADFNRVWSTLVRLHSLQQQPEHNSFEWHLLAAMKEEYGSLRREYFPLGAAIAVATLLKVHHAEAVRSELAPRELAFGNYGDNRYAWELTNVRPFEVVARCNGQLGIFELDINPALYLKF